MKLKHVLTGSVMGLSLVTAGVITTSVLPTSSVEAAEYRKIYADVTAQMGLDGNLYLEVVGDRPEVSVSSSLLHSFEVLEADTGRVLIPNGTLRIDPVTNGEAKKNVGRAKFALSLRNGNPYPDGTYLVSFKDWTLSHESGYFTLVGAIKLTIKDGEFVKYEKVNLKPTATPTPEPKTPEQPSGKNGWVGRSYYQNGQKVISKWIYDSRYKSYFYLDAVGEYVENAWVGNYYLKSGGYMAKSEWIYDANYGSYYYLTSEGSYARNAWSGSYYLKSNGKMAKNEWIYDNDYKSYYYLTSEGSYARNKWVGDYYLKSNGKMAVSERTPDGYRVDGSGKWIK